MSNESNELGNIWDEARGLIERGEYDRAIEIYQYILIRYDADRVANEHANAYLGDVFLTLRNLDRAESHFNKAIILDTEKPDYHYSMGVIFSLREQWQEAVREFQSAYIKAPGNAEFLRGLGWATFNQGYQVKGLEDLHRAHELAPLDVNILNDLGAAYLSMTCFDMAQEQITEALKINPSNAIAQNIQAKIAEFRKMFEP